MMEHFFDFIHLRTAHARLTQHKTTIDTAPLITLLFSRLRTVRSHVIPKGHTPHSSDSRIIIIIITIIIIIIIIIIEFLRI